MCVLRVKELEQTELSVSYRSLFVLTLLSRNIKKQWNARFLLKKTSWNWKLLTWFILWILALKSPKAQFRMSWFCWSCPRRAGARLLSAGVLGFLRTALQNGLRRALQLRCKPQLPVLWRSVELALLPWIARNKERNLGGAGEERIVECAEAL